MKISELKLSSEEDAKLDSFIGKCIRRNSKFPLLTNRVGVGSDITIQEIYNQNPESIKQLGKFLNKLINDNDPEFSSAQAELKFGTILATELKEALKLILKEKEYKSALSKAVAQKRRLLEAQESLKTPEEKRKEIDAELAELSEVELEVV